MDSFRRSPCASPFSLNHSQSHSFFPLSFSPDHAPKRWIPRRMRPKPKEPNPSRGSEMTAWRLSCENKRYLSVYPGKKEGWLGWSRAAPSSRPGLGVPALTEDLWSCWHSAKRGLSPPAVSCPQSRPPTGPAAPGLGRRPWVLLVSILEGFTVKIAPVRAAKLQTLVCYEATVETQPLPRAGWTEVAAAGGQGHVRDTSGPPCGSLCALCPMWGSKVALKPPQEDPP